MDSAPLEEVGTLPREVSGRESDTHVVALEAFTPAQIRERQERLRGRLSGLGFDDVRFASVDELIGGAHLRSWLEAGHQADMTWIDRTLEKRENPDRVLPGARSVIMLGVNYWSAALQGRSTVNRATVETAQENRPIWARYALHADYHDTIKAALIEAGRLIQEIFGLQRDDYRAYVDTGPVMERGWAARAGTGFIGKNAMLISRSYGNWLFLAAILTRIPFQPDPPIVRKLSTPGVATETGIGLLCGKCTRCLDACPTNAFAAPGVVNARRCISYQTIENKGIIPRDLRAGIGLRVYGCDVCLEVCPWNRFAQEGRRILLSARHDLRNLRLQELLSMTPESFAEVFRKTAIKRLKLTGLLRNACVVAGNAEDPSVLPELARLARHGSAVVRVHAVWAVFRLNGGSLLAEARAGETDPDVLAEYGAASEVASPIA